MDGGKVLAKELAKWLLLPAVIIRVPAAFYAWRWDRKTGVEVLVRVIDGVAGTIVCGAVLGWW